ncbi:HORMA-1 domain-containing protein [Pseudomonas sp. RIT-To-2]|uniref:HORMA-1 domain-containing protein n=1 Tax=Pseudomonas sp. RIT-To-2 TaxID=3462541 RepID=UPI0024133D79
MSSSSYSVSESQTFTLTHAKHMAAKVAADLMRLQRLYGKPSTQWISDYEEEVTAFLKAGYLDTVTYGFKRDGKWIEPTLKYTASELSSGGVDDTPGRIRPNADITGASFYSYMTYNDAWRNASQTERDAVKSQVPVSRGQANEPEVNGYLTSDNAYSSGGHTLNRSTVRSY